MSKKFVILICGLMKEEEQRKFEFLAEHGIEYEYVNEYIDDTKELIERHLKLEKEAGAFSYSQAYLDKLRDADVIVSFTRRYPPQLLRVPKRQRLSLFCAVVLKTWISPRRQPLASR